MNKDASNGKHCDYNNFKRARYFNGMLMTDRDFREEQIYLIEKRKLLNRMLHGWGVVCGLKVKPTNTPGPNVIVEPGMALDCHGNEILVCAEQTIDLTLNPCSSTQMNTQKDPCAGYSTTNQTPSALYVVIKYQEGPSDPVPVYAPGGSCTDKTCEQSRIHEGFCIEVWDQLPISPQPGTTDWPCKEPFPCPPSVNCPDPHYILLATISCNGERVDGVFNKTITNDAAEKISYSIKRTLNKVCISKGSGGGDANRITAEDSYSFNTEVPLDNINVTWAIDTTKLNLPNGVKISEFANKVDNKVELTGGVNSVIYHIVADSSAGAGTFDIQIPVSLQLQNTQSNVVKEWTLPPLQSPIEIGTTEPKRGSTISAAMIRNIEQRKFVATFPLFSWLLTSSGREEGQVLSGNVSVFCKLLEKQIREDVAAQLRKISERLDKLEHKKQSLKK